MAVIERTARVRPWFRRVALIVFVLLLPVALHAAWDYIEARRLGRLVADVQARHEPVAAIPTFSVVMGEEKNAARFYDAASALLVDTSALYGAAGLIREIDSAGTGNRTQALAHLRGWLQSNADAESMLARATEQPFVGYPAGTDYNYRWDRLEMLANLTSLRSMERMAAGDAAGALRAATQQIALCRAFEATDGASLVPAAWSYPLMIRSVASAQAAIHLHPSDDLLRNAQAAFRKHDLDSALEQIVLRARATTLGTFWDAGHGWYARPPGGGSSPATPLWVLVRPLVAHRVVRHAREMSTWLDISRRPWPDRLHVPVTRSLEKVPVPWYEFLEYVARMNLSAMAAQFKGVGMALASIRTVDAALGVERYRLAHDGRPPASLAELVPAFLADVPIDPYSGRYVLYKVTPGRYVVYCLGPDEKDDGGTRVEWPRRAGSLRLVSTPPPDIGIEGSY